MNRIEFPNCDKMILKDMNKTVQIAASSDYIRRNSTTVPLVVLEHKCRSCTLFCTIYSEGGNNDYRKSGVRKHW